MADYFFGLGRGQGHYETLVQSSTTARECEFRVNTALDRQAAVLALDKIKLAINQGKWPPI